MTDQELQAQLQRIAGSHISRRGFLAGSSFAAMSAFLAACSSSDGTNGSQAPAKTPIPSFAVPADIEKKLNMYN